MKISHIFCIFLTISFLSSCAGSLAMNGEKNKKRANAHFNIGIEALRLNQLAKAFDELMQADSLLPNQPLFLDSLANAWRAQGDFKHAESYFKRALKYGDIPSIHTNYASLLLQLGRHSEAKRQIEITLKDPRYPKQDIAHIILGDALIGEGYLDDGIMAYRRAGQINPRQIMSQLREASAYTNSGRYSYAVALYETILRKYPMSKAAILGILPLLKQQGELAKSRRYLVAFREKANSENNRHWASDQLMRLGH